MASFMPSDPLVLASRVLVRECFAPTPASSRTVAVSSRWVRADGAPVEEIFAQSSAPTLTLITCGGEYRPETREYLDRLIVRARGA